MPPKKTSLQTKIDKNLAKIAELQAKIRQLKGREEDLAKQLLEPNLSDSVAARTKEVSAYRRANNEFKKVSKELDAAIKQLKKYKTEVEKEIQKVDRQLGNAQDNIEDIVIDIPAPPVFIEPLMGIQNNNNNAGGVVAPVVRVDENLALKKKYRERKDKIEKAYSDLTEADYHHSNYFLTINTHISGKKYTPEEISRIAAALQSEINAMLYNNTGSIVKLAPGTTLNDIDSIQVFTKPELQQNNPANQLHAHSIISIRHNKKVQLDYAKIKQLVDKEIAPAVRELTEKLDAMETEGGATSYKMHIERSSGKSVEDEFIYVDKETGLEWEPSHVGDYYKELKYKKDNGLPIEEGAFDRFEKEKKDDVSSGYVTAESDTEDDQFYDVE